MPARKIFDLKALAALQAANAAQATSVKTEAEAAAKSEVEALAAAAAAAAAAAEDKGTAAGATTAAAEDAAAAAGAEDKGAAAAAASTDGVQAFLQQQIKDKDTQILQLSIDLKSAQDRLGEQEATFKGLVQIASDSIATMSVACGQSAPKLDAFTPTQILAEHSRLSQEFHNKFKAGGVAAVDAKAAAGEMSGEQAASSALHQARLKAVR